MFTIIKDLNASELTHLGCIGSNLQEAEKKWFVRNQIHLGVAPLLPKVWILDPQKAWKMHFPNPFTLQNYPKKS